MSTLHFIELITRQHNVKKFDCGDEEGNETLNLYLKRFAVRNSTLDLSKTYVAVNLENKEVQGYYTLSTGAVALSALPVTAGMPRIVPSVHLGRLATDKTVQGQGLGSDLLIHAFKKALAVSRLVGARFVEVHALNQRARSFYLKRDFTPFLDDEFHLYLEIASTVNWDWNNLIRVLDLSLRHFRAWRLN